MKDISPKGWATLAVCAFCPGVTFSILITGIPFWVNDWMETFGVSRSVVMTAFTAAALITTFASPLIGRALDFLSVRRMVSVGALMMAAGFTLTSFATEFWQVLAMFASLCAVGGALSGSLPAQTLATRMYPQHAGLVNGLITVGMALGGVFIAATAPRLVSALGWRETFLVAAGVLAIVVAPVAWFALNVPAGAPGQGRGGHHGAGAAEFGSVMSVLKVPMFWIALGSMLPITMALAALPPNLSGIGKDLQYDLAATGSLVGIMSICSAAGSLTGGWLSDRLQPWLIFAGVTTSTVLALLSLALGPPFIGAAIAVAVFGFAGGTLMPWVAALIARRFGPAAFARVLGLLTPFFIPAAMFPVVIARIRDTTGSYQAAFITCAVMIAAGALFIPLLRGDRRAVAVPAE